MRPIALRIAFLAAVLQVGSGLAQAGGVEVGASRDVVIGALGRPQAELSAGPKDILTYRGGMIILIDGKVARIQMALPKPRRAPAGEPEHAAPAAAPGPGPAPPAAARAPLRQDEWFTDYGQAMAEASASRRRVLALFTGTDWCPACRRFESEVARNPDFLATTRASFVLLRLDYPAGFFRGAAPGGRHDAMEARRLRFRIRGYPSLRIISADDKSFVSVDNTSSRSSDDEADYYVQAIDEARRQRM
ncbi:MAG TPA: thioredoxin family protein [Opitutaceae bacterium]